MLSVQTMQTILIVASGICPPFITKYAFWMCKFIVLNYEKEKRQQ